MKILAISGSLRADSFNTQLLQAAGQIVQAQGHEFEIYDYADVPLYNQQIDGDNKPDSVKQLITAIESADGLLVATPEYNYSFSGVLKNAIDWASRPAYKSCLAHKKVAIVSASMSPIGGVRAQAHLRDVFAGTLTDVYRAPDFALATAQNAFSASGSLLDEKIQANLNRLIEGYLDWLV
ncbi:NAD(P)H-dependent oxidoreductase [Catenovulum sp. 2E275]|uniref:NADPH-dependent FMN reductase n=1 Tax=Catenovulum sp. 2E275 TaxID=2980497 RepID=UPI0021D0A69D|nr:NADPH-dependent FMN reductase [Catenovulum sp. 2E275]MCU4676952.1 NAD(P)H-dependent oxidoreductase [Catenovulum sp. 2E275]